MPLPRPCVPDPDALRSICARAFVAEGYCWARTAERQASRMRARYLRAVLRQDMEFFDLRAGLASEVVASLTNDSLAVQHVLSERVPNLVMNATMFVGSYAVAFVLLWRLALAAMPSVLLLVVPGVMYGRVLTGLAGRIRERYARAGAVAERAVSSVRTVYSFVAETGAVARFSAALEEPARLGLRQGLVKGVAVGSNGVTFAVWAFNVWYGSRLVMYRGCQGGTVFAVSTAIVGGGTYVTQATTRISLHRCAKMAPLMDDPNAGRWGGGCRTSSTSPRRARRRRESWR
jgi:ATP-binding cassette, subfamily B (MDR/TAP), member 1